MSSSIRRKRGWILMLAAAGALAPRASAQVWDSGGGDESWTNALNWDTRTAPPNNGTANLTFGTGAQLNPFASGTWDINTLTFNSPTSAFVIGGNVMTIRGGITDSSPFTQIIALTGNFNIGASQTWNTAGDLIVTNSISAGTVDWIITGAGSTVLEGGLTGSGTITKNGAGTLGLGNDINGATANLYTGPITVNGGTLALDKGGFTHATSGDVTINNGAVLTANGAGQLASSANLTVNYGFVNLNATNILGSLTLLRGTVIYSGPSITLTSSASSALTIGGGITSNANWSYTAGFGAGVTLAGNNTSAATLSGTFNFGGQTRTFTVPDNTADPGDDLIVSGAISNGSLAKAGPGTLMLGSASNAFPVLDIQNGTVRVASDGALGTGVISIGSLSTLETSATFSSDKPITMSGGGTISTDPGTTLTLTGNTSGSTLTKSGAGTLVLAGNNTFSQGVVVQNGTLGLGSDTALGLGSLSLSGGGVRADGADRIVPNSLIITGAASFSGSQDLTFAGPVQLAGTLPHMLTVTNTTTLAGVVSKPGNGQSIFKLGAGTLILSGHNTFTDLLQVNEGTLSLAGGSTAAPIFNYATFISSGGTVGGSFDNYGDVSISGSLAASVGMLNYGTTTILPGASLIGGGAVGIENEATLNLSGGTLAGSGFMLNDGLLNATGTIAGSGGLDNSGLINITGLLTLSNSGASGNTNAGEIDVPAGAQLLLTGSVLANFGAISLTGGVISGPSNLANAANGSITGHGLISAPFANSGNIIVTQGTLNITQAFTSSGQIQLAGATAALIGGAITNTGSIQGAGAISSNISNTTGTIEALGGTLTVSGNLTSAGLLATSAGNKLLITKGLAGNAGIISLSGGTFDNNNFPLNNPGQITGYGTFRSGGLTNNGSITFTGGVSTINGPVTNSAGKKIEVANNPAIFTGLFNNFGIFKNTKTTVTFAGGYVEHGQFISDPADSVFSSATIAGQGAWDGGTGDHFIVTGDLLNQSTAPGLWNTALAELHFTGGADHLLASPAIDLGAHYAGYQSNFAWGILRLDAGDSLRLIDGSDSPGAAIYVSQLALAGGVAQLDSISSDGVNLYYDANDPANAYLGRQTYVLSSGAVVAAVPEPASALALCMLPLMLFKRRYRR